MLHYTVLEGKDAGASFQLFLGDHFFIGLFFNATALLKNWNKQHSTCTNLKLRQIKRSFFQFPEGAGGSRPHDASVYSREYYYIIHRLAPF